MMRGRMSIAAVLAMLLASAGAAAQSVPVPVQRVVWLPGPARTLSLSHSASRDAPALEWAIGPRGQATIGLDPGLLRWNGDSHDLTVGTSLLVAAENPDGSRLWPGTAATRDVETLSVSLTWPAVRLGTTAWRRLWEATLAVGHESSHLAREQRAVDPYRPTDIPFGGGGWYLVPDLAFDQSVGARWRVMARAGDRIFVNAFPAWVGQREASNHVADGLGEGLLHAPFGEVSLRLRVHETSQALLSLFGEAMIAHDDSASNGELLRLLGAWCVEGAAGQLWPFLAVEAGNGQGVFINRRELRLAVGVRHVLW